MKYTKGKWEVQNFGTNSPLSITAKNKSDDNKADVMNTIAEIYWLFDGKNNEKKKEETEANAKLIAEAGTVTNETGYTPRQLAEQKTELLFQLQVLVNDNRNKLHPIDREQSIKAIKKATS